MLVGRRLRLGRPGRLVFEWAERHWARRADRVMTVSEPYADLVERDLRIPRPTIVMNVRPIWTPPSPRPDLIRAALGLRPETAVVLVRVGGEVGPRHVRARDARDPEPLVVERDVLGVRLEHPRGDRDRLLVQLVGGLGAGVPPELERPGPTGLTETTSKSSVGATGRPCEPMLVTLATSETIIA